MLNVHTDGGPFARVENTRSLHSIDQVRDWCGNPRASVHVRQVIDLNEHRWNEGHDPCPAAARTGDTSPTPPACTWTAPRPSRTACDCDHIIEPERGGTTCSCNLAPLCRGHHRLKTHGGWTYTASQHASSCGSAPTDTSTSTTSRHHDISADPTPPATARGATRMPGHAEPRGLDTLAGARYSTNEHQLAGARYSTNEHRRGSPPRLSRWSSSRRGTRRRIETHPRPVSIRSLALATRPTNSPIRSLALATRPPNGLDTLAGARYSTNEDAWAQGLDAAGGLGGDEFAPARPVGRP